jgi:hypothetical protein
MDNFVYILSKQPKITIERLHICTWSIERNTYFTEYGMEIKRGDLKKIDLQMALPLPLTLTNTNFKCLYNNIINTENCRFIFNAEIKDISPINGQSPFGTRIEFNNDRKITALPIDFPDNVKIDDDTHTLSLTIDINNEQISDTIYVRFLIKTDEPAFSYEKKEVTKRIITNEVRVNECRTASPAVIKLQKKNYEPVTINKCFCFNIIPNSYSIDFIDDTKLKTIRGLEATGFNHYLDALKEEFKLSLKEHEYNIVFSKQENNSTSPIHYSFFSRYSKEYIGNIQIGVAVAVNILCSLLFACGSLHPVKYDTPFFCRIALEYYIAITILICLIVYLLYCRFWRKA